MEGPVTVHGGIALLCFVVGEVRRKRRRRKRRGGATRTHFLGKTKNKIYFRGCWREWMGGKQWPHIVTPLPTPVRPSYWNSCFDHLHAPTRCATIEGPSFDEHS
jgi:hypothetical protein